MANTKKVWYVHPVGRFTSHTSEVVTRRLSDFSGSSHEHPAKMCADKKERGLIDVPNYSFIRQLRDDRTELQIEFETFLSINEGKPARWKLGELKRKLRLVKRSATSIKQRYKRIK